MNKFSTKNINYVGLIASLLAFVSTFVPFYKVQPTAFFYNYSGTATLFSIEKNLVSFNAFGVICLLLAIASAVLYVLNFNQKIKLAAMAVAIIDLFSLMLALIVGNGDVKDLKSSVSSLVHFSSTSYSADAFIKSSLSVGFVLELIMILLMFASYWIDVMLVKPYVFGDKGQTYVNPLYGLDIKSHSKKIHPEQYSVQQDSIEQASEQDS